MLKDFEDSMQNKTCKCNRNEMSFFAYLRFFSDSTSGFWFKIYEKRLHYCEAFCNNRARITSQLRNITVSGDLEDFLYVCIHGRCRNLYVIDTKFGTQVRLVYKSRER